MPNSSRCSFKYAVLMALSLVGTITSSTMGATRTWIGGNADWVDNGSPLLWSPNDEPEFDDLAIFNSANSIRMGSGNSLRALTISGGFTLNTNGYDLAVNGHVQMTGANTKFIIGNVTSEVNADDVTINSGAMVELAGGTIVIDQESGFGILSLNAGGSIVGYGTINLVDTPALASSLLNNNGTLTALSRPLLVSLPPPNGTLSINGGGAMARIDLDGSEENGAVHVERNQTLDINLPLADAFHGTLNLFHNSVLDIDSSWTLAGGSFNVTTGFVNTFPPIQSELATIKGGAVTQSGGTIAVVDEDGSLQFDAAFTMNGGSFVNNGLVIFNANATIASTANFTMPTDSSSITVNAGKTVIVNQTNFKLDGNGSATNVLAINSGGMLALNLGVGADTSLSGTIRLNQGTLKATTEGGPLSFAGNLFIGAGSESTIEVQTGQEFLFQSTSHTMLDGDLRFVSNNAGIAAGATFSGTGALIISEESQLNLA
ncbi:MAG: hypothetical protein AB7J13_11120, partial [Pyrinomonadaceae bacterium]